MAAPLVRALPLFAVTVLGCQVVGGIDDRRFVGASVAADASDGATEDAGACAEGAAAYRAEVERDGPVALWHLDEPATAMVADDAVGQLSGDIRGGVELGRPSPLAVGSAARFDGVDDLIVIDDDFDFWAQDPFTVELWVRIGETNSPGFLLNRHDGTLGYSLVAHSDPAAVTFERSQPNKFTKAETPVVIGEWMHIVGRFDGDRVRVYRNGILIGADATLDESSESSAPLLIGSVSTVPGGGWFAGEIDEVAVYDRALDESRIHAHYCGAVKEGLKP